MDFQLSDEELMIQSMIKDLAQTKFSKRSSEIDEKSLFPADNINELAELG